MAFAIWLRTPPPTLMAQISIHLLPHTFLLQLNPTYMKRILHLVSVKNITFKIDIHQQLQLLTANYLAMFKVASHMGREHASREKNCPW